MHDFHYTICLLKKLKKDGSHLYMFVKSISIKVVCVPTQNIEKYLCEYLFSWGTSVEQHPTVNCSYCIIVI